MIIPPNLLPEATLTNLIEDFVTREGTDNGDNTPLATRIDRVKHALAIKQAFIVFHQETQSCGLMLKQDIPKEWLEDLVSSRDHLND